MSWKHMAYHIINSDPGHTRWKQRWDKYVKITFASPSKSIDEKEKEKKKTKFIAKRFALHANTIIKIINSNMINYYWRFIY